MHVTITETKGAASSTVRHGANDKPVALAMIREYLDHLRPDAPYDFTISLTKA